MSENSIDYQTFLTRYKAREITVLVDKSKAGDFVMSEFADKHNKLAHLFWTWLGIVMVIPLPIILLIFRSWNFALGSLVFGLVINSAARKSASEFVLQNMIEDENFGNYVLLHKGAVIQNKQGNNMILKPRQNGKKHD